MLVLTRKPEQGIHIGDIVVRILGVNGDRVKLGIEAPREFRVWRSELLTPEGAEPEPRHKQQIPAPAPAPPGPGLEYETQILNGDWAALAAGALALHDDEQCARVAFENEDGICWHHKCEGLRDITECGLPVMIRTCDGECDCTEQEEIDAETARMEARNERVWEA